MTDFEKYLLGKGYVMHHSDHSVSSRYEISTMTNLFHIYKKEGCKPIYFGLSEGGMPPLPIDPLPYIVINKAKLTGLFNNLGVVLQRALSVFSNEEIYKSMMNSDIVLDIDMSEEDIDYMCKKYCLTHDLFEA